MRQREIMDCVEECLRLEKEKKRCSMVWFEDYRKRHNLVSTQILDREIFFRMYDREPRPHEIQRVRFWRLSQHLPKSREECIRLGQALELSGKELDHFLTEGLCSQRLLPIKHREKILGALFLQYLCRISPVRLDKMHILPGTQRKHIRHIFYADAIDCLDVEESLREHCYREHLYSRNFSAEFQKYMQPYTVISRENMIRLLILLLMPDIDGALLDRFLILLGYGPLNPQRMVDGFVDLAIVRMLNLCVKEHTGDWEEDKEEMKRGLRLYDKTVKEKYLAAEEKSKGEIDQKSLRKLRFMKFYSMDRESAATQEKAHG